MQKENDVKYIDPFNKEPLEKDSDGNYFLLQDGRRIVYKCYEGCCDFSSDNASVKETKDVYDEFYAKGNVPLITVENVTKPWHDATIPWRKTLLETLGPLSGRKILLIGNGKSYREFYFLLQGASIVFTDLSIAAAMVARDVFRNSELWANYRDKIGFHSVDASHMPFPDSTFDIILGTKVVSFIKNQDDFFREVSRCLKPGGRCRFVDDAYSPAWEAVRLMWRPIKVHVLWRLMSPLSRVRSGGTPYGAFGFKEELLVPYIKRHGFTRMVFLRQYFFLRLAQLGWAKVFGWDPKMLRLVLPIFYFTKWVDERLAQTRWMKRNSLPLIFGFDK